MYSSCFSFELLLAAKSILIHVTVFNEEFISYSLKVETGELTQSQGGDLLHGDANI